MCNKKHRFQTENKVYQSKLSTRSKNALFFYNQYIEEKSIREEDIRFEDIDLDLTRLAKMRRVGIGIITEVENFYQENNLPFSPLNNKTLKHKLNIKC